MEWLALVAAVIALAAGLIVLVRDGARGRDRNYALALAAVAALAFVARTALTRPTFLHANFHAGAIVGAILEYPQHSMGRVETYGRFGFLALGLLTRLLGQRFEVVCALNQAASALTLLVAAWIAFRVTRRRAAGWFALAAGALHPAIARVAGSEDAHSLGMLLGVLALWTIDVWAETRRRAALIAATAALLLALDTRQTLYVLAPCVLALALSRGRPTPRQQRALAQASSLLALWMGWRALITFGTPSENTSFIVMLHMLTTPSLLMGMAQHHPLTDVARFGPSLTLLLALGAWRSWRARGPALTMLAALSLCAAVSFAMTWRTPGVELAFRLPAVTLALVVCGVGGAWLDERIGRRPLLVALVLLLALTPPLTPAFAELRRQSADFLEYSFVRDRLASLPRELTLVRVEPTGAMPSYEPPIALLRHAGIRVHGRDGRRVAPIVFVAGVQCWSWSLAELLGLPDDPRAITRAQLATWGSAAATGDLTRVPLPGAMRPECARLLTGATPLGAPGAIAQPLQDMPFVLYGRREIPLQLYRLE